MREGGREVSRIKGWTDRQTEEKEFEQLEGERSKKKNRGSGLVAERRGAQKELMGSEGGAHSGATHVNGQRWSEPLFRHALTVSKRCHHLD